MVSALDYLAGVICFGLFAYKWVIIAAVLLTWVSADPFNPIVRFIARSTQPVWVWCESWMPVGLAHLSAYASLLVVIFAQALIPATLRSLGLFLEGQVEGGRLLTQVGGHALQSSGVVLQSLLFFLMLIMVVWFFLTLVSPALSNPFVRVIHVLADPLITPLQRYLPRSRVDFSPLVALLLFFLMNRFVVAPLAAFGNGLSFPISLCVY
jgi:YggT family protein